MTWLTKLPDIEVKTDRCEQSFRLLPLSVPVYLKRRFHV